LFYLRVSKLSTFMNAARPVRIPARRCNEWDLDAGRGLRHRYGYEEQGAIDVIERSPNDDR
jgi:hypothetical protein